MNDWRSRFVFVIGGALLVFGVLACQQTANESPGVEEEGALNVTVRVKGIKDQSGQLIALLFRDPDGFPENGDAAEQTRVVEEIPSGQPAEIQFGKLSEGTYAITVLHDENGDEQMNRSLLGVPKEGYGISTNPSLSMGAPSFENASFTLTEDRTLTVNIYYLERRRKDEGG